MRFLARFGKYLSKIWSSVQTKNIDENLQMNRSDISIAIIEPQFDPFE